MEASVAVDIFSRVRTFYNSGKKSFNKVYVLNEEQMLDDELAAKAKRRSSDRIASEEMFKSARNNIWESYNTPAGNCFPMAMRAAALAIHAGHQAMIGKIQDPGDHAFCVVDFPANASCPIYVRDMCWYALEKTWIIDPWMNICCEFRNFPAEAKAKFKKWSGRGKRVMYGKEKWEAHDPIHPAYSNGFFMTGPLRFDKVNLVMTKHLASGIQGQVPWII